MPILKSGGFKAQGKPSRYPRRDALRPGSLLRHARNRSRRSRQAASEKLHPIPVAGAMDLSSISGVAYSLRLSRIRLD